MMQRTYITNEMESQMTANVSRVLAHSMARELTAEEVNQISGGAKTGTTITIRSTGQTTTDTMSDMLA